jgi:putative ABC transport system permease protein
MISNYIKIAWRNLLKNKVFSFINIVGLAISMSVCLLIISIIADQKKYDQFHSKKERIYRIISKGKDYNEMNYSATSALPLGQELSENYVGIEAAASLKTPIGGDLIYNQKIVSGAGYFADGNLFKILDFDLIVGDPKTALQNPRSLVISQDIADKLFYKENPIGKTIKFNHNGLNPMGFDHGNLETPYGDFIITGVLKPNVDKTHLNFKLLASLSSLPSLAADSVFSYTPNDWSNIWDNYTYVLLQEGKTQAELQVALDKISDQFYPKESVNQYAFTAQSLTSITPGDPMGNETHLYVPKIVLFVLGLLCLIVMISACLNYTNLSIARSLTRAKEVGIRKVSGAGRGHIFAQFIAESLVISVVSLIFSIVLLFLLQNLFSSLILNKYFSITFDQDPILYLIFLGFSILVGLIAGILPSIFISTFNPIQILKNLNTVKLFKRITLRKALLVTQFSVSLIFIISTTLIYLQTNHIFNFNYGFDQNNIVNIKLYKTENYTRFIQAISGNKDVLASSACKFLPATGIQNSTKIYKSDGRKDSLNVHYIDIDDKCLDVWGLKLVAGKNLPDIPATSNEKFILINEKMVSNFNYGSPSQAIGQRVSIGKTNVEIVGVVKDFHFLNVNQNIEPLMLRNRESEFGFVTVKIAGKNASDVIPALEKSWKQVNPETRFDYEFYDQQLLMLHMILRNAANILMFIAFLAVFISCLGLLGMATYTAETRQKEISVRKVLGASVTQLVYLLSKGYMFLLLIAVIIATPVAYFINNAWLQFFPSRISISPLVLIGCIFILIAISFLTVFSQVWTASRTNPVKSLKSE